MKYLAEILSAVSPKLALRLADKFAAKQSWAAALKYYAALGRRNVAEAEFRVSCCYINGHGVPVSQGEGLRRLERAAELGWGEAQANLAWSYMQGVAVPNGLSPFARIQPGSPDWSMASHWARKAADNGIANGYLAMAHIHACGPQEHRNGPFALRWYELAAETGSAMGSLGFATLLSQLERTPERSELIIKHLRIAGNAGLPNALYYLGALCERGDYGLPQNASTAAEFYEMAGNKGQADAQRRLGMLLLRGNGIPQNVAEAETWLRKAALAGDADSAALVGDINARDGALPSNLQEALSWYQRAADAGHERAKRILELSKLNVAPMSLQHQQS